MLRSAFFVIILLCCPSLFASPSAAGLQGFALRLLLQQVYFQEYLLVAAKPEQYQLTHEQMQNTWLGGYLALNRFGLDPSKITDHQSLHLTQAKDFHVSQQQLELWQKQSTKALYTEFLSQNLGSTGGTPQALQASLQLDTSLDCQLPEPITQALLEGNEKFTRSSLWQQPKLQLGPQDLDCISLTMIGQFQGDPSEKLDPQSWLGAMTALRDEPILRLLVSWRALHALEYRSSLDYLYPIVFQDPSFRYAYEAIQRVYQFAEKGKGAVALKRL